MKKRIILIALLFGLLDVFIISCCKDSIYDYTKLNSIKIVNTDLMKELVDSSIINKSNFRIKCIIDEDFIANNQSLLTFSNYAYATSCENMGLKGLKNDIVKVEITCNKKILNIPAGDLLNIDNKIKAYEIGFYDDAKNNRITIEKWLNILNNGRWQQSHYEWYFEFQQDIVTDEFLKFNLKIELADGTKFESETNNIKLN